MLGNALNNLPTNNLFRFPSGNWGFRGLVSVSLCYIGKDGSEPTVKQLRTARSHGPRLAGLTTRTWATKQEALEALASSTE